VNGRWITFILAIMLGILFLAPFIVPVFIPWSAINCKCHEINIKTGQVRYSRCLWYITISEKVEDTTLSRAMRGNSIDVADIQPWQRVNTFSPFMDYSPHYIFHSAISQISIIDQFTSMGKFTPEQKQEIAEEILTAWQKSGSDDGAEKIISRLLEKD
jgi:hypothetical protein